MENIGAVLRAQGLGWSDVVKCTVMLANMADWAAFNRVYLAYFPDGKLPARSAFGAAGLALGALVELECLAYAGDK
jgi:enamine deaminase RidA (YjgF/YER057c/UK114 family)